MNPSSESDVSRTPSSSSFSTDITQPPCQSGNDNNPKVDTSLSSEAFNRWRPSYHLQAPSGWMNDPCAPAFDPETGLYHVSYQSNLDLKNPDWGDIAWRSATSPDLVSWTVEHRPAMSPDTPYDGKGVFTGCMLPSQVSKAGTMTCVYTSVNSLPIHHTIPHAKGCESLSMATSVDGGKTWDKFARNPILPNEPEGLDVTGWRDPFVGFWPSMAKFLDLPVESTLFGIISGGIRDVTPTTFLYAIAVGDLAKWRYIGPLVNVGCGMERPMSRWTGDWGRNWEVTNFMTLRDERDCSIERDFLVMGTESSFAGSALSTETSAIGPSRPVRGQLWMSGSLKKPGQQHPGDDTSSPVQMQCDMAGHLDHGCFYAANSFFDPKTSKNVVWGWITEDDLCDELRHAQGWSGLLSLPRQIGLQTMENVVSAWASGLGSITSIECEQYNDARDGTATVRTLGSEPVPSVVKALRRDAAVRQGAQDCSITSFEVHDLHFTSDDVRTMAWELDCSMSVSRRCSRIGIQIIHSQDHSQTTTLSFCPPSETFTIERPSFPSAGSHTLINSTPETAPHTLFTLRDTKGGSEERTESLRIRAWRDNSVLEVFVNGRTAISTRLYAAERTVGIRFFANDGPVIGDEKMSASKLLEATLWDGIGVAGCTEKSSE